MTDELRDVTLRRFPVKVLAMARERNDELMREFSYIANPHPDSSADVPARLVEVINVLRSQYADFTTGTQAEIDAAEVRGDREIEVTFTVPAAAAGAAHQLGELLDEADEYCRSGDLLALSTEPLLVDFRHWYLEEFERQIAGQPPNPWPGPLDPP